MSATLPLVEQRASVLPLRDARDATSVGGKAATLARLSSLGVAVPDGVVLPTSVFAAHLAAHNLDDHTAAIRDAIVGTRLDPAVRAELVARVEPFWAHGPVVVRSSAVGEDSAEGSFAGQLDSILHVGDADALERAVVHCWASYWSERAVFYRRARSLSLGGMGVIVQRQVAARCAGVCFTDDGAGELLIEFGAGLADALVAGSVEPGRIAIDRRTGVARVQAPLGASDASVDALMSAPDRVAEFRALAQRLESILAGPQDVEWAIDDHGTLHVVQSRPITAPLRTPPMVTRRRIAWSNANVAENFPDPLSPLLYSIASAGYTHYFRNLAAGFGIAPRRIRAMESSFASIVGVHGGRLYYNLTSIHRVLRLAPFGHALAHAFDTFVGARGQDATRTDDDLPSAGPLRQRWEVVVIAAHVVWQYLRLPTRIARFEQRADHFAACTHPTSLATATLDELRRSLAAFMDIRLHRWNDAALADAASMACYAALERLLARVLPDEGAVHTSLLKAIPDVVSSKPVVELWRLSRIIRAQPALAALFASGDAPEVLNAVATDQRFTEFRHAFDAYVEEWGFRCSRELMLTAPSFQEAPEPLVAMLRSYANLDGESPVDALARQAAEREAETARVLGQLCVPLVAAAMRVVLGWTQASIRFRERARLKQALLYSRCRRIALAIGAELVRRGVLDRDDDIFWLTTSEIDELAGGRALLPRSAREMVVLRRAAMAEESAVAPPDVLELDEGEHWTSAVVTSTPAPSTLTWHGTSACGGRVTGRAAVLRDVTEAARLADGDVLVTRQTDPGWGPVFFLIKGLVIERGGMLSHGAIIAREFGIPCVVGVKEATARIPDGSTLTVDGDRGVIRVD